MAWFFAFTTLAVIYAWWRAHRRAQENWERLETILTDLVEGRAPRNYVFVGSGAFSRLPRPLETLAQQLEKLRGEITQETFNLQTILASMEEGVMVVDAHHVVRLVNPSFIELFDLKLNPLGQTVLRVLRESDFEKMVTLALKTDQAQSGEVALTGGKPARVFAVHAVPMRDQLAGLGVVTIFRDISRLRQLEDVRREFVANVSHELRTPLSIFHGYLENLLDDPEMAREEQREILEILRKHSMRLNALLEDLLVLARLESRHVKLQRQEIPLQDFLEELIQDWTAPAARKKIKLACHVLPDVPPIFADRLRLEQVLSNLLENAVKYTESGGSIRLSAERADDQVILRVEDDGIGILPSDLPHIFERFYRADKARSREQGGTGLGLSIVKHIVQSHGGSVTAESRYGEGTAILLKFPLNTALERVA